MGNISPKEAFAASMAEAQRRANIASTLGLSLQERVQILKVWILPVVLLTASAYYPDPVVISSLTTVFNTTLGFDSWGITIQQMAKMKTEGGHELASPYVWLMTQAGSAFSSYVSFPSIFTTPLRLEFDLWARKYGVDCQQASLPYLSLGPVPTKTMGFLAHSLKAFSKARQHVLDGPRKNAVLLDMPLWHNSVFTNSKSNTYYCPSLIRTGVTRVKHLYNEALDPNDSILAKLALTWQPVYRLSLKSYTRLPISLWSLPSTWSTAWGTSAFLKKAASSVPAESRQEPQVWASFWTSKFPPSILSFVYQALWKKLKVGDRLKSWTNQPKLPRLSQARNGGACTALVCLPPPHP